ncbi:MAG TPA: hypothetical protein EYP56_19620 [Planctomycetaceae bacterium]|nr:hypothetical protein [Planctomycetaceae bacterium]
MFRRNRSWPADQVLRSRAALSRTRRQLLMVRFASTLPLLLSLAAGLTGRLVSAGQLEVGVARVDLTPPAELKAGLGGYGQRMGRPAEGVHDRIYAKALVMSSRRRRFAIVTADVLGFPPPIKPAVLEQLADQAWGPDELMLLPSHSHTSIDMMAINPRNVFPIPQIGIYNPKLYRFVVSRLAQVVRAAAKDRAGAVVGTAACRLEGWNRNRRHDDGPVDSELVVTRIDSVDGRPIAALVGFSAHPTILLAEHMQFSGGWPGHLQRGLETLVGNGVTAMYYNGAQGDQSPVLRGGSGSDRWEASQRYGHRLADEAFKLWRQIQTDEDVTLVASRHSFRLPKMQWHLRFTETGGAEYGLTKELLERILPLLLPREASSTAVRLNDWVLVGVPGEMIAELGLELKKQVRRSTGAPYVAIGGLADEWISYILSESQYRQGGYEASVSFYGHTLGRVVLEGCLRAAAGLGELGPGCRNPATDP